MIYYKKKSLIKKAGNYLKEICFERQKDIESKKEQNQLKNPKEKENEKTDI